MKNKVKDNILDIINILGYGKILPFNKDQFIIFKQEIKDLYKIIHNFDLNDKIIDKLFITGYFFRDLYDDDLKELELDNFLEENMIDDYFVIDKIVKNNINNLEKSVTVDMNNINNVEQSITVDMNNINTVEQRDEYYNTLIEKIKPILNKELKNRTEHYDYLRKLPQPVQKSKEWYELRNGMITASSAADILGESHYKTRDEMLLDKIGKLPDKYKENQLQRISQSK